MKALAKKVSRKDLKELRKLEDLLRMQDKQVAWIRSLRQQVAKRVYTIRNKYRYTDEKLSQYRERQNNRKELEKCIV